MSGSYEEKIPKEYLAQLQQRMLEFEKIMEIGRALTAKQSIVELLKKILQTAAELVDSEVASIMLKDDKTGGLHIRVSLQPANLEDVAEMDIPVPMENSVSGEIFRSGKPVIVQDAKDDPRHFKKIDDLTGYETRNLLGVPLIVDDNKLGVLMATNKKGGKDFSLSDQELLVVLASHASVSLENTRLYAELQEYAGHLEEKVAERTQELEHTNAQLSLEIEVRKRAEIELERLARTDPLTGIYNRRYFFELAQKEFARAQRYDFPLSVMMFDIDHFKRINDTHGHFTGDQVLRAVAGIIRESMREVDIFARYGGEEFVMLLPETGITDARKSAERLRAMVENKVIDTDSGEIQITASIGLASLDGKVDLLERLLDFADVAMYGAKQKGRNRVNVWE